jgi:3-hydroxyacyl-CoA dehydrogenase
VKSLGCVALRLKKDLERIKHVIVLAQGVMGPDIALNFALAGYEVTGVDILEEPLNLAARKTEINFSLISAALALAENKVASPEDVDSAARNGFGLRLASVGPLQFLDMCGLDTVHNVFKYVHQTTGDPRYQVPRVPEEKLAQGNLGVKSGRGFYEYEMPGSNASWERTDRGIIRVLKAFKDFESQWVLMGSP